MSIQEQVSQLNQNLTQALIRQRDAERQAEAACKEADSIVNVLTGINAALQPQKDNEKTEEPSE